MICYFLLQYKLLLRCCTVIYQERLRSWFGLICRHYSVPCMSVGIQGTCPRERQSARTLTTSNPICCTTVHTHLYCTKQQQQTMPYNFNKKNSPPAIRIYRTSAPSRFCSCCRLMCKSTDVAWDSMLCLHLYLYFRVVNISSPPLPFAAHALVNNPIAATYRMRTRVLDDPCRPSDRHVVCFGGHLFFSFFFSYLFFFPLACRMCTSTVT